MSETQQPKSNPALGGIHQVLAGYLMHWHRLAVDASLFTATGSLTITGFMLSADDLQWRKGVAAIVLLLLFAIGGGLISSEVHSHVCKLRGMIQKIDQEHGVFNDDFMSTGGPLYPKEWLVERPSAWTDPITVLTKFASVWLPVMLAAVVAVYVHVFSG